MVIGAEVGYGSDMGVLILWLGIPVVLLVGHVVHTAVLILLAVSVHHRRVVSDVGVALFLPVAFLVTVAADDVRVLGAIFVSQPIVAGGPVVGSGPIGILLGRVAIPASMECCYLLNSILSELLKDDRVGLFQLQLRP